VVWWKRAGHGQYESEVWSVGDTRERDVIWNAMCEP